MESVPVMVIIICIIATAISVYAVWFYLLCRKLTGPKVWPLVGSLPSTWFNRSRIHDWVTASLRETGSSATYQTCTIPIPFLARKQGCYTLTCHPRNMEHILKTRFHNYPKGPTFQAAFHDFLGRGIFNSDGNNWQIQRKTAAAEFTTKTLRQSMTGWLNRTIKNRFWLILDRAVRDHKPVDLQDLLTRLTFDNICCVIFGKDPESLSPDLPENPFAVSFDIATELSSKRIFYSGFFWRFQKLLGIGSEKKLKKSLEIVQNFVKDATDSRKLSPSSSDDLLSRFMEKRDEDGNCFPTQFLQQIALNFLLAGRDTTAATLSWFFWLLMNNPEAEKKIVKEISTVLRETRGEDDPTKWTGEPLGFEEAEKLVYLKAALTETLRLYPPLPLDMKHVANDDVLPDGTRVPKGSTVTYSIYSVGRMETIWGEDCLEFRPERWLSERGDRFEPPLDGYKFMAFNAGPRICLGKDMAYLQMKAVASAVLMRYRLVPVPDHRVEQKMSLSLFMKNGLLVYLHPRLHPLP